MRSLRAPCFCAFKTKMQSGREKQFKNRKALNTDCHKHVTMCLLWYQRIIKTYTVFNSEHTIIKNTIKYKQRIYIVI